MRIFAASWELFLVSDCKNFEHGYALNFRRIVREKAWFFADSRRLRRHKTLRVLRV